MEGGADLGLMSTTSLISERETKQREVDEVLSVFMDVQNEYGTVPYDVQIATMKNGGVLAYYDSNDNLAVNASYFNSKKMTTAYDESVAQGYHPGRGDKTAMQAVVAHELGHTLTARAAGGFGNLDSFADKVLTKAAQSRGAKNPAGWAKRISGYAQTSPAEAIAEAWADVYCNGSKAHTASRAIVNTLNGYLKKGKRK